MNDIIQLIETRKLIVKVMDSIDEASLRKIPEGYSNNVIWNFGHLAVTQQLLHYKLCKLPLYVDEDIVTMYGKGSSPKNWAREADIHQIRNWLTEFPMKLSEDYGKKIFKEYNPYTTSAGITLHSIEDAIRFNNFHEGIHLGYVLSMKKHLN